MPAFTPGPWKHELIHGAIDIFPASNTDNDITTVYDLSEEGEANARLIAAAPDMYKILCDIRDWCEVDDLDPDIEEDIAEVLQAIHGTEDTDDEHA